MKRGAYVELYDSFRKTLQQLDCTIDSLGVSGNNNLIWRVDVCDSTNLTLARLQTDLLNCVSLTPQNRSHRASSDRNRFLHITAPRPNSLNSISQRNRARSYQRRIFAQTM